jgi:hypothetical protein
MSQEPLRDDNGEATTQLHEVMADAVHDAEADPHKREPVRGTAGEVLDTPDPVPHGGTTVSGDDGDNSSDSGNDVDISVAGEKDDEYKAIYPQDSQLARPLSDRPGEPVVPPSVAGGRTTPAQGVPLATVVPGNVFQQYSSTANARDAAERFTPKTFVSNGTSEPDNRSPQQGARLTTLAPDFGATTDGKDDGAGRVVAGASATLDARAEQAALQAINDKRTAHGGGRSDTTAEVRAYNAVVAPLVGVRAPAPVVVRLDPLSRTPTPIR